MSLQAGSGESLVSYDLLRMLHDLYYRVRYLNFVTEIYYLRPITINIHLVFLPRR